MRLMAQGAFRPGTPDLYERHLPGLNAPYGARSISTPSSFSHFLTSSFTRLSATDQKQVKNRLQISLIKTQNNRSTPHRQRRRFTT